MASSSALHTFRNTSRTSTERDAASTPDDRLGERLRTAMAEQDRLHQLMDTPDFDAGEYLALQGYRSKGQGRDFDPEVHLDQRSRPTQ